MRVVSGRSIDPLADDNPDTGNEVRGDDDEHPFLKAQFVHKAFHFGSKVGLEVFLLAGFFRFFKTGLQTREALFDILNHRVHLV